MYEDKCLLRVAVYPVSYEVDYRLATYSETIKDIIAIRLWWFLEDLQILEHLRVHFDFVLKADAVLSEEVENDRVRRLQRDMLEFERTATYGIRLVLAFLIACTQRELIDEIDGSRSLAIRHLFGLQVFAVILTNPVHMFLSGLVEALFAVVVY